MLQLYKELTHLKNYKYLINCFLNKNLSIKLIRSIDIGMSNNINEDMSQ